MHAINCHLPLKVRLCGEPSEDDWAKLEDALTEQYSRALQRSFAEISRKRPIAAAEDVREPFRPSRFQDQSYLIPTYDDGELKPQPLGTPAVQPAPATSAFPDEAAVLEEIRKHFPGTQGRPKDGLRFGVYRQMRDDKGPELHYLDVVASGRESRGSLWFFDLDTKAPLQLSFRPGNYLLLMRPHGAAQLYWNEQLLHSFENTDNLDLAVNFFVPAAPGAPPPTAAKRLYHFYPRLQVLRASSEETMTTGADSAFLAHVEIWRVDDNDNWNLVYGLAWIYAFVHYNWRITKVLPPAGGKGPERRVPVFTGQTHNAFLHYTWSEEGNYEVECEASVHYEDASPRAVVARRQEKVLKFEVKQALILAQLEAEEAKEKGKPGRQPIWFEYSVDLLEKFEEEEKKETNEARKQALQDAIQKIKHHLYGSTRQRYPIRAIFTERKTSQTRPLSLFLGPSLISRSPYEVWHLIDLTYPPFYRTYTGQGLTAREAIIAAFDDARTTFHDSYPPGRILARLEFRDMDKHGLSPQDFSIETESWQRTAYEWLSIGAQVVGAVSLAAAFVFPPSAILTGVIVIGAVVGAAVSVANIIERIHTHSFEWNRETFADIINIAASLALAGGAVARGAAGGITRALASGEEVAINATSKLAKLVSFQRGLLYMGLTADVSNGILISYDTYIQLRDIDAIMDTGTLAEYRRIYGDQEGRQRWERERQTRVLGILARAALNTALTVISIRGSARAIAEGRMPTGQPQPPATTTPATATSAVAAATNATDYLNALRQEVHTAGSVGRGWDHTRFPQAPRGTRWQPGDPIDMPSTSGEYPTFDTARERYWRNRAHFELEARRQGQAQHQPNSKDPVSRLSDSELQALHNEGRAPAAPDFPGKTMELEHSGVPQRVERWLRELGFANEEARRLAEVAKPGALLEETPLGHAFHDVEAWSFGSQRADVARQRWAGTPAADVRSQRPLISMSDATLQRVVGEARQRNFNFNKNQFTRELRAAIRDEITVRGLNLTPP
jgi:hypothetical protein